jgi:hypothetical protein
VSSFARPHTLMPMISRVLSRCTRAWAGVRPAGSRVIAALAAAAILLGANAPLQVEREARTDALRGVSTSSLLVALHSAPLHQLTLASRSGLRPSRWSSSTGAALPAPAHRHLPTTVAGGPAPRAAHQRRGASVAARGYDATAPPALS